MLKENSSALEVGKADKKWAIRLVLLPVFLFLSLIFYALLFDQPRSSLLLAVIVQVVGRLLNELAVSFNGGRMPVLFGGIWTDRHQHLDKNTRLKIFCDVIQRRNKTMSVGDVFMEASAAIIIMVLLPADVVGLEREILVLLVFFVWLLVHFIVWIIFIVRLLFCEEAI